LNKKIVDECIRDLLLDISANPLIHFSEKALQVRLASKLLTFPEFADPVPTGLPKKYEKELLKLGQPKEYFDNVLSIPPLQMEYGTNDKGAYRIDIVILDASQIKLIESWQFKRRESEENNTGRSKRYKEYYLDPAIGIEIGTEKTGMSKMSQEHLVNDAKKLKNVKHAYVLNVIRNTNVSPKKGGKYCNKELQIKKFKDGLVNVSRLYPEINWIGIVLHIAYKEVEFFDAYNKWVTITIPSDKFIEILNEKLSII
jgi:hypothetical protein